MVWRLIWNKMEKRVRAMDYIRRIMCRRSYLRYAIYVQSFLIISKLSNNIIEKSQTQIDLA